MTSNETDGAPADAMAAGTSEPIWLADAQETEYPSLEGDRSVEVTIVGAGIVGLTTAVELCEAGYTVAVIESGRIARGVTARSTAKLTALHGLIYDHLISSMGEDAARAYARANHTAIDEVEARIDSHGIDAEFQRTPAYTYTTASDGRDKIEAEVDGATRLDLPASITETTPLPYDVEAAVKLEDQARFNPRRYLVGLAEAVQEAGGHIFEETTARTIDRSEPNRVVTDEGTISTGNVVVATHFPFYDQGLYFARLIPKRSYLMALRLEGGVPEGLYYREGRPYFSVRPHPTGASSMLVVGGQAHRTGHGHPATERYRKLEREARHKFDVDEVEYRWSTQDFVSIDQIPYIGQLAPHTPGVYVATGFGGWGLTNGTAAGLILSALVRDGSHEWEDVFRPTRFALTASVRSLVEHNTEAAKHFVAGRLTDAQRMRLQDLSPDQAAVIESDDGPIAAYRDAEGDLHAVSARCTHLDCRVRWNDAEKSWDCPCHGSRFTYDGAVLDGPATDPLPTDTIHPFTSTTRQ